MEYTWVPLDRGHRGQIIGGPFFVSDLPEMATTVTLGWVYREANCGTRCFWSMKRDHRALRTTLNHSLVGTGVVNKEASTIWYDEDTTDLRAMDVLLDELARKAEREHMYWDNPELYEQYGDASVAKELPVSYEEWLERTKVTR